jgi:hypothetical protein
MRVKRKTLRSTREGGRLYVLLDADPTGDPGRTHDRVDDRTSELVDALRGEVERLHEQLAQANERDRENRRLLAAALERIPAIEAPGEAEGAQDATTDAPGPPERGEAGEDRGTVREQPQAAPQRPWWRRVFGA